MAYINRVTPLFLVALILFQLSNPSARAQLLRGLSVTGQVFCSPNGNSPGKPLAETVVNLNCSILGVATVIGQNTTNANGTFNIGVPAATNISLGLPKIPCVAMVQLPLNSTVCPELFTATGVLASSLQSVGTTLMTPVFGLVQKFNVVEFFNVAV